MTMGILATLKIKPGTNAQVETAFKDMMAAVKQMNPATNFMLHRSREDESTYIVMEQYDDQAAVDVHGKSDAFKAASAALGGCMAGPPEVKLFDGV